MSAGLPPPALVGFLARAVGAAEVTVAGLAEDPPEAFGRGLAPGAGVVLRPDPPAPGEAIDLLVLAPGLAPEVPSLHRLVMHTSGGDHPRSGPRLGLPGPAAPWRLSSGLTRPQPTIAGVLEDLDRRQRSGALAGLVPAAVGALARALAAARGSRRMLEVGAGSGAASLWLGGALPPGEGRLIALERDSARFNVARKTVRAAELAGRVDVRLGEVERLVDKLGGGFDLLFMDEGLEDRAERLELLLDLLAPGALILVHGGREDPARDAGFQALLQLDPRVGARVRLGIGEGLALAIRA